VADAGELGFDLGGAHHMPVRQRSEIELDPGAIAPVERNLVDGRSRLAAIHRRGEVPGRVEMGAVVGRERDPLDCPALAVRQVLASKSGKVVLKRRHRVAMGMILDLRSEPRRISRNVVFQRDGEIDDARAHG
jgi:hypothetical protein